MKILRNRLAGIGLGIITMLILVSCGNTRPHCYLCQGIPCDAPCLVDLSTGEVVPLTVDENSGALSIQFLGDARIELKPGEACATIPTEPRDVNTDLFCDKCRMLIAAASNSSYVLADMKDIGDVRLYPIEAGRTISIRNYIIAIAVDGDRLIIQVFASEI